MNTLGTLRTNYGYILLCIYPHKATSPPPPPPPPPQDVVMTTLGTLRTTYGYINFTLMTTYN